MDVEGSARGWQLVGEGGKKFARWRGAVEVCEEEGAGEASRLERDSTGEKPIEVEDGGEKNLENLENFKKFTRDRGGGKHILVDEVPLTLGYQEAINTRELSSHWNWLVEMRNHVSSMTFAFRPNDESYTKDFLLKDVNPGDDKQLLSLKKAFEEHLNIQFSHPMDFRGYESSVVISINPTDEWLLEVVSRSRLQLIIMDNDPSHDDLWETMVREKRLQPQGVRISEDVEKRKLKSLLNFDHEGKFLKSTSMRRASGQRNQEWTLSEIRPKWIPRRNRHVLLGPLLGNGEVADVHTLGEGLTVTSTLRPSQ
ncbi:unnamed protein product [Darwinula stevensoni]|uniref:Uncharacterized protein n=1 Tax=Darwinula stevensoni TaxID=69355 RepID=A0A7R9FR49_9CRUS|nr:unnamed protein product [Darwinula stevensoni]CAG0900762.1 unnamed protein product [Darwinula stevensoni]